MRPPPPPHDRPSFVVATSSRHVAAEVDRRVRIPGVSVPVVEPTAAAIDTLLAASPQTTVILDATQKAGEWLSVLQQTKTLHPQARVVVVGPNADLQAVARAILAGACHFLPINMPREDCAQEIAALASGRQPNEECLFGRVRAALPMTRSGAGAFRDGGGGQLSYEQAVRRCDEFGLSPDEIAKHLDVDAAGVHSLTRRTRSAPRQNPSLKLLGATAAAVFMLACGYMAASRLFATGVPRYRLSGTVTFEGRPVPRGSLSFTCTESGGHLSGYASIVDGTFDTLLNGKGHVGGKHRVTVMGFGRADPQADEEDARPTPLFEPIEWEESLRGGPATLTIGLPR